MGIAVGNICRSVCGLAAVVPQPEMGDLSAGHLVDGLRRGGVFPAVTAAFRRADAVVSVCRNGGRVAGVETNGRPLFCAACLPVLAMDRTVLATNTPIWTESVRQSNHSLQKIGDFFEKVLAFH